MKHLRAAAVLVAVASATALPATARADDTTIVARDVPLNGARVLEAAQAPIRFDLVGLHWQGTGTVLFRTRALGGRWSAWQPAAPEAEDLPDPGSREVVRTRGWRLGNPYWTGPSDRIQYRLRGKVSRLRAYFVWSPVERTPTRTLSAAGSPPIVSRFSWHANERIRRAPPQYAPKLRFAIVHHTAGSNDYTRQESAAIVKGIEVYHVKGNGWNDIGYNFLVDKYGQVFEGRYGGITRNVIGAHARGFNVGSVGVAVLGNYQTRQISPAAYAALVKLLAWRLDIAHVDPTSTLTYVSGGNSRFPKGVPVFLRAISAHRDVDFTSCPGNRLYAQLPSLAQAVARTGLPKLYEPDVRGALGGKIRFTGLLSSPEAWEVKVVDSGGRTVAGGKGSGSAIDWTWNSAGVPPGRYRWTIEAGQDVRPASGTVGRPPPVPTPPPAPVPSASFLSRLALTATTLSSNGGGVDDSTEASYTLTARSRVSARVQDSSGATVETVFANRIQAAGSQSFDWSPAGLPDGSYRLVVTAHDQATGQTAEQAGPILVDRTLSPLTVSPATLSPGGAISFGFTLAAPVAASLQIFQGPRVVAQVFSGNLQPGTQTLSWNGKVGRAPIAAGGYQAVLTITDAVGAVARAAPLSVGSEPLSLALVNPATMTFSLNRPAQLTLDLGGQQLTLSEPAGQFAVPQAGAPASFTAVARDATGTVSSPVTYP